MTKLKCKNPKCEYEWEYNGNAPFYACCPRCSYRVNIASSVIVQSVKAVRGIKK